MLELAESYSQSKNLSAKTFLATEQRIPGLGNGVLQDILYNAKIHPKRKINTLSRQEIDGLYAAIVYTLNRMTEKGGRDGGAFLSHRMHFPPIVTKNNNLKNRINSPEK